MTLFASLSRHRNWLFSLFLLVATFTAYHPAWHGGYIWDDEKCVSPDPAAHSLQGLREIWLHPAHQFYPLTYTACWLEFYLWGYDPTGYHLINILLQVANAVLLWIILRRLSVPGAWLAAAVFALHPVNVQSVAWISERKNTLSCFFYLCSIMAALKFWLPEIIRPSHEPPGGHSPHPDPLPSHPMGAEREESGPGNPQSLSAVASAKAEATRNPQSPAAPLTDWKYYWLSFALFLCALLGKTITLPLPAVILLLVWWKRGKIAWRDIYPCFLFLAVGVALGLITRHSEHHIIGASGKEFEISFINRCLIAGRGVWFYLEKLFWPHPLMFIYPRWKLSSSSVSAWICLLAVPSVLAFLWLKRNTWGRPVFVAFAYFIGLLFVMLGFFNIFYFRYSFVSDHFQYLACMGPLALAAAGVAIVFRRFGRAQLVLAPVLSACLLALLATLTWAQCREYASVETLWRTTLAQNPGAYAAHNNLGDILLSRGQSDAAIEHYRMSLALHPDPEIYHNLGNALLQKGRVGEAAADFEKALEIQPDYATAYSDLGTLYLHEGQIDRAIQFFQKALQIEPGLSMACYNLGNAYIQERRLDLAIEYWQKAVVLEPGFAAAHNNLGNAYMLEGRIASAIQHWKAALEGDPGLPSAQVNLAWALATCPDPSLRDGAIAVALAERANQGPGGGNVAVLRTLAAAYAENGQYPDAVAAAQQALQIASLQRNPGLVSALQSQLNCYQNHQPFRDPGLAPH